MAHTHHHHRRFIIKKMDGAQTVLKRYPYYNFTPLISNHAKRHVWSRALHTDGQNKKRTQISQSSDRDKRNMSIAATTIKAAATTAAQSTAQTTLQRRAIQCSFSSVFHLRNANGGAITQESRTAEKIFTMAVAWPMGIMGLLGAGAFVKKEFNLTFGGGSDDVSQR